MPEVDIQSLRLRRAGRLYRVVDRQWLTQAIVGRTLSGVVSKAGSQVGARTIQKRFTKQGREIGRFSFVAFKTESSPAFIEKGATTLKDLNHGFVALFERHGFVMISSARMRFSKDLISEISQLTRGEMQSYAANGCIANESATLRALDINEASFRAQRVEGTDLSNTFPAIGSSRLLLTTVGVLKEKTGSTNVVPSTGGIRTAGSRADYQDYCSWAASVIDDARAGILGGASSSFINMFAIPIDLSDLPTTVKPTALLLWLESLTSGIEMDRLKFWLTSKEDSSQRTQVPGQLVDYFLSTARQQMKVLPMSSNKFRVEAPEGFGETTLQKNSKSYSLRTTWSARVRVEDERTGEVMPLATWLRNERCLHLVFSDIQYGYSDNTLFRDSTIKSQITRISNILVAKQGYRRTTKEKQLVEPGKAAYKPACLFGQIESELTSSQTLICDDMKGEWADYIVIENTAGSPTLTFIHAKSGDGTIAPAMFQEVVSQAVKNLGRRHLTEEAIDDRRQRWNGTVYESNVPRIRRGGSVSQVTANFKEIMKRPDVRVKVVLAVSFLSRSRLLEVKDRTESGHPLDELETQLAWLLTSFMSSCQRVGAVPEIWCRP